MLHLLENRYRKSFDRNARDKAVDIVESSAIESLTVGPNYALSQVIGSNGDPYSIGISVDPGAATEVSCTCPRFADGHYCKHIYAVLIVLDEYIDNYGLEEFLDPLVDLGPLKRGTVIEGDIEEIEFADNVRGKSGGRTQRNASALSRQEKDPLDSSNAGWQESLQLLLDDVDEEELGDAVSDTRSRYSQARVVLSVPMSTDCRAIRLRFEVRRRMKAGRLGQWKALYLAPAKLDEFEPDVAALFAEVIAHNDSELAPASTFYENHRAGGPGYEVYYQHVALRSARARDLLRAFAERGLLFWSVGDQADLTDRALQWSDAEPSWQFQVDIESNGENRHLKGVFRQTGDTVSATDAIPTGAAAIAVPGVTLVVPGPDGSGGWIGPLDAASRPWLKYFLAKGSLTLPASARNEFLKLTSKLGRLPDGERPDDWDIEIPLGVPEPVVRLSRFENSEQPNSLCVHLWCAYGDLFVTPDDPEPLIEVGPALVRRDIEAEQGFLRTVSQAPGLNHNISPLVHKFGGTVAIHTAALPEFVGYLTPFDWIVEADGKRLRAGNGSDLCISVEGRVESGIDWFDLEGEAVFGKASARVPALLQAINRGQNYVVLDDGSHGLLPQQWIDQFKPLAAMAQTDDAGHASFRSSQTLLLDAMLSELDVQVDFAEVYLRLRDRIASATNPKPKGRPPGFRGSLRDYQKQGVGWLSFLRELDLCGCLADDMGLGKTIQVLAHLEHVRRKLTRAAGERDASEPERRLFLAVVPKSLVFNWIDEAERFVPKMRVVAYHGGGRHEVRDHLDDFDLLVTTYGTMRIDIEQLRGIPFDTIVLDESQAIKNSLSQAAKASRLLDAKHRIAMTGTPVENHLGELWSLFEFLNPGMLGRSSVYKDAVRSLRPSENPAERFDAVRTLGNAVRPFLLRRTKQAVLTELPAKTEQQIHVELSKTERKAYNDLAAHYRAQLDQTFAEKGFEKSQIVILEALLRLRQAACHPGLLDKKKRKKKGAKVEVLVEQISEVIASGHKALVFSQFVQFLDIVRDHLDKSNVRYEYLDGKTNNRKACVDRFQKNEEIPLFLISLKAGGHGLNLTAADHVFILDPWWNPAVEAQAVDRAHRMGQERPVVASRLIAKDTVEEKIVQLKESKRKLADALVSNESAVPRGLTEKDVRLLLS